MPSDLRTKAIVLRRTNYGESDRILTILTPEGKLSVLARGVRKEKSLLAGGIELFSLADIVVHQGRSRIGTLTSAKMLQFFGQIMTDISRLELASKFLKTFDRATEQVSDLVYFDLLVQILTGINQGLPNQLVEIWGTLNLARVSGEEINLIYDINGKKLDQNSTYHWEQSESALCLDSHGDISAKEIKFARFLLSNKLALAAKVDNYDQFLPPLLILAKTRSYW